MEPMADMQLGSIDQVREAFESMDVDHNGYISASDLLAVFNGIGDPLTDEEALKMIQEADINNDGLVDFEDFNNVGDLPFSFLNYGKG